MSNIEEPLRYLIAGSYCWQVDQVFCEPGELFVGLLFFRKSLLKQAGGIVSQRIGRGSRTALSGHFVVLNPFGRRDESRVIDRRLRCVVHRFFSLIDQPLSKVECPSLKRQRRACSSSLTLQARTRLFLRVSTMIKCPLCQFENEDGALFCEHCKSDLGAVEPAAAHAAARPAVAVSGPPAIPSGSVSEIAAPLGTLAVAEALKGE